MVKAVLVRDMETKCLFAHAVPCKGADEEDYVASMVASDVLCLGHIEVILKGDNEPALQALIARILQIARVKAQNDDEATLKKISKEEPPAHDSQSNGGTEVGVMLIRGIFRTLKLCLEARIGKYVPVAHAVVSWLLEHSALMLNIKSRGPDGITAWCRARGRPFGQKLLGFGEMVLYKLPSKGPQSKPDGNMGTRMLEGVFLGYNRSSNTYIIGTVDGITLARSITRMPEPDRWSDKVLSELKATPWSEREKPTVTVRFQQAAAEDNSAPPGAAPAPPRRFRINASDLKTYGYTDGCPQCGHSERYGRPRAGGQHSTRCRDRILEEIGKTEVGKRRLEEYEERVTRAMVDYSNPDAQTPQAPGASADAQPAPARAGELPAATGSRTDRQVLGQPAATPPPADEWPAREPTVREALRQRETENAAPRAQEEAQPPMHSQEEQQQPMDDAPMGGGEESEDVNMGYIGCLEPSAEDYVSEILLQQLGSSGRSFKREAKASCRRMVSEMFSPPRVTAELHRSKRFQRHLIPGFALDYTVADPDDGMPWDFSKAEKREKARKLRRKLKPYVLIGSPECTPFSTWQYLNAAKSDNVEGMHRAKVEATVHMQFMISLYYEQIEDGHYFLHEHPRYAASWYLEEMQVLMQVPGVKMAHADQCQYGCEAQRGQHKGAPICKPTGFLSNGPKIREALSKRCTGANGRCSRPKGGRHLLCSGAHARDAAKYSRELCRAILKGVTAQLRNDALLKDGCFGIQVPDDEEEIENNLRGPEQGYSGRYRDDISGQILKDSVVQAARAKELLFFHNKGVWMKKARSTARAKTGRPPISVRWVDVNKGDDMCPNYRSRLVARQMKAYDKSGQSYFAPAPPLEALRTVLSLAMTRTGDHQPVWDPASPDRTQISFVDVTRAYFNARLDEADEPVFVDLPPEDADHRDMCAQLLRHMYGTRMAADGWQEEYSTMLIGLGFRQGASCPNVFWHPSRQICCSVHGDDFTSSGPAPALDWLEKSIGESYEITIGPRLGPGPNDAKEARALNRIVRWCEGRLEYEADPRQVERLIAECGLTGSKPVATPGVKPTFRDLEEDQELEPRLHTAFRGAAARGNYLAADRIDAQYACKEVCRWMSRPTAYSWQALKRLCRYLQGLPRLVYRYEQQTVQCIDVYTDTDWAGCPKTRKSTSGGCVMMGRHAIKHWSSTQASVALSSGEAEFAGVIRGSGQGLGYQSMLRDFGLETPLRVWTDSSAAIGICTRQGLGKLRHLDTHTLWVQQAVRLRRIDLRKVDGEVNPADLMTKHSLSRDRLEKLVELHGCRFIGGRAESAPLMREGRTDKVTMATADRDLGAVSGEAQNLSHPGASPTSGVGASGEEETSPTMPHLVHDSCELDALYPPIVAPEDDMLDDPCEEGGDATYQQGLKVAHEIREMMQTRGRVRRMKNEPINGENTEIETPHCKLMSHRKRDPSEMATTSPVCHRRSVKTYPVLAPASAPVRARPGSYRAPPHSFRETDISIAPMSSESLYQCSLSRERHPGKDVHAR